MKGLAKDPRSGPSPRLVRRPTWEPEKYRDILVVVLTVTTGATDAIGFLRLGGVFTSVMTANMVLLGISAGRQDASLALHAGAAFAGFIVGAWLGARFVGGPTRRQPVWPREITVALGVELVLFAGFAAWWEVAAADPSSRVTYALIAINAVALGIQSGAVLRFGVPGLSTTFLTGTLTQFVASLADRRESPSTRSLAILAALVAGGALGAALVTFVPRAAPAAPGGVLVLVLLGANVAFGRDGGAANGMRPVEGAHNNLETGQVNG